jgi:two-component system nitrate/nitrite response regulator NarL
MAHAGVQLGELTTRERDVLLMAADGLSSPYIAGRLQLSPATVNTLLLSSFGKLGVGDRAAAVAAAQASGLLEREAV